MESSESIADDLTDDCQRRRRSSLDFPVVGIGASAGGLQAAMRLFEHIPSNTGMAFVLVLHLSPRHESNAAAILQRATRMPVLQVAETVPIEPDRVYVIPPAAQLMMVDGKLKLESNERSPGRPVAIDVFFRTLAQAHGERAVAVVLSGTGSDGTVGLGDIKAEGGVSIAQLPSDAEYDGMPSAAIASERVDFVLPAVEMPQKLVELWENARRIQIPQAHAIGIRSDEPAGAEALSRAEEALRGVMAMLTARTGNDFHHYKRATVLRRIERRMQVTHQPDLPAYRDYLAGNPAETEPLLQDMLISVTSFFRDRTAFDALERAFDANIAARRPLPSQVRAWSVGCATGEEAYSLAILLNDLHTPGSPLPVQVFGSDIDERALGFARSGVYPEAILTDVPLGRLRQHFQKEGGAYRIKKQLREQVMFATHNILRDPPFSRVDVISCRNLLIYLEREVQMQVLEIFQFALNPGGLLFLGSAETADCLPAAFSVLDKKHRIYRVDPAPRLRSNLVPLNGAAIAGFMSTKAPIRPPAPPSSPVSHLHQRLIDEHQPASIALDEHGKVLHTSTGASRYLRHADGVPSEMAVDLVRAELTSALRNSLLLAQQSGRSVAAAPVRLEVHGVAKVVLLTIRPSPQGATGRSMLLVIDELDQCLFPLDGETEGERDRVRGVLEEEVRRLQLALRGSMGESSDSTEALRTAYEELQSINEELRSTSEELETSKEELQSVNEELTTVNFELKGKVEESSKINDDLSNLIASMNIATVFVDRAMRIKRFTPLALDIFNILATDVGRSLLDLTHRLDYPALREDLWQVLETLRFVEREVRGQGGRWFLARLSPYRTNEDRIEGAVINFIDVTALHRAQEELRARDERLRLVAESTKEYAIATLDNDGDVTSWNRGAELLFGYTEREMLGQHFGSLFVPEDRAAGRPEQELGEAREHGRSIDERWHVRKDGSRFFCSGITTTFQDGEENGFAKICRDLTERQLLERQREELLAAEQQVRQQLEAASSMRSEFLAVTSHELKNPLNLILMRTELLARAAPVRSDPALLRSVDVIRRTVRAQSQIIDDLLDLSRLSTGKLSLHRTAVLALPVVERIVEALTSDAQGKGVALSVTGENLTVFADSVRLEQVIWNLLSNAMKFTQSGGRIDVALERSDSYAQLSVGDTGRGIDPDVIHKIFDMFEQGGAKASTRETGGLGIGLALVKQLVALHDGHVEAHSDGLGRGSTFRVRIPLYSSVAGDHPDEPTEQGQLTGLRILAVEDNVEALESMTALLSLEGAQVIGALSAPEALALAEAQDFDLVLSDLAMPGTGGLDLIRELQKRPRSTRWPAIAISGFSSAEDRARARAAGFAAFLEKPLAIDELHKRVRAMVRSGTLKG